MVSRLVGLGTWLGRTSSEKNGRHDEKPGAELVHPRSQGCLEIISTHTQIEPVRHVLILANQFGIVWQNVPPPVLLRQKDGLTLKVVVNDCSQLDV